MSGAWSGVFGAIAAQNQMYEQKRRELDSNSSTFSGSGPFESVLLFRNDEKKCVTWFTEDMMEYVESLRNGPNSIMYKGIEFQFHKRGLRFINSGMISA